jgi:3-dehydroquinate synthase
MPERVPVKLGKRSYDIIVGERVLADAGKLIAPHLKSKQVVVISDEQVARFHLHRLTNALEAAGIRYRTVIIGPGESTKSLTAFSELMETLLEQSPDRDTTLLALGGGVVGDVTGFAASILLRGVDFIQIPTTLLAQVDSSVGGKTGINSRFGKNLIGSFHQPKFVLADVATLATLPKRELLAGYAETLKYGLIKDQKFFAWLEKNGEAMLSGNNALLIHAVVESCKAKAAIVAADEKESGKRALLNFGHTFAHALEAETGYSDKLLHGEAVAIGMILALQLSVKMKLCKETELKRVLSHYKAMGLPASPLNVLPKWDIDRLMEHFAHDKKTRQGQLNFILTRGVGKAHIEKNIYKSMVSAVLAEACRGV